MSPYYIDAFFGKIVANYFKIVWNLTKIRGKRMMLDEDLARLYEVETKQLTRQVRRNSERFPDDFMFRLTKQEFLRCQFGTSNKGGHV